MNVRVDDGKYHVVRFTRSGANSTLQLDEMQVQTKHPIGNTIYFIFIYEKGKGNMLLHKISGIIIIIVNKKYRYAANCVQRSVGNSPWRSMESNVKTG